jgi:hypothetical protein
MKRPISQVTSWKQISGPEFSKAKLILFVEKKAQARVRFMHCSWAQQLIEVGFFEARGSKDKPTFWVPFLYRDALSMSQGSAEE